MQQNINALQHQQLDLQQGELEYRLRAQKSEIDLKQSEIDLKRYELAQEHAFKQRQLDLEAEVRRLAIERADQNEQLTHLRLVDADRARLEMARRGQTAAIWLAYPILLGSFAFGVALVLLTVVGAIGPVLGGTLGGLFVGGPLLASTAKVIHSFTGGGTNSDVSRTDSGSKPDSGAADF